MSGICNHPNPSSRVVFLRSAAWWRSKWAKSKPKPLASSPASKGWTTATAPKALKGVRISVPRSAFPATPEGEYYWVDLIGLRVVNREGVEMGIVRDLMPTGPNSVLVLEYTETTEDGKEAIVRTHDSVLVDWTATVAAKQWTEGRSAQVPAIKLAVDWRDALPGHS